MRRKTPAVSAVSAVPADFAVRSWHLTAAMQRSEQALRLDVYRGDVPAPDRAIHANARVWNFETIRRWRPEVAEKILKIRAIHEVA